MANDGRKRSRIRVKDIKYRHDPMIRFYEKTQDWLQDQGRSVLTWAGASVAAIVIILGVYYLISSSHTKADAAFAAALEKFNAPVVDTPTPYQTGKTYSDEKQKWEESTKAFEDVATQYSSRYGAKARYYEGVSYLHLDRDKGLQLLEKVAGEGEQPTSDLAAYAIAENEAASGETDKAVKKYESLLKSRYIPKQAVQVALGQLYEKTGDKQKAVEAYFEVAKADRDSRAGSEAEKRLSALAPERLKELPPPSPIHAS